ncbi:MAG: hypothetical protein ACLUD0_16715 [Eubacterium ramulus]
MGKYKNSILFWQIETVSEKTWCRYELHTPIRELSEEALTDILYGYPGQIRLENASSGCLFQFAL